MKLNLARDRHATQRSGTSVRPVLAFVFILAAWCSFSVSAETGAVPDDTIAANAKSLFADAIQKKSAGLEDAALSLFAQAADLFEAAAAVDWRQLYEAGNARWWAGQADKAIVDYRRYLAHDPLRGEVWENLAQARRKAGTQNPGHEGVLVWPWYLWLASGAAAVGGLSFLAFSLFLFWRAPQWRRRALYGGVLTLCLGLGAAGTLFARGDCAVLAAETPGRKGDAAVYAVWPADPWKAGQEVWVTGTRDTWTRVRVGDTVSWVPTGSLVR